VAAPVAMNSPESVSEHTAVQIGADLALDEAGDRHVSRSCTGEEGLELVADDLMEEGLLGLVTFVPVDGEGSGHKVVHSEAPRRVVNPRARFGYPVKSRTPGANRSSRTRQAM